MAVKKEKMKSLVLDGGIPFKPNPKPKKTPSQSLTKQKRSK